MERLQAVLAPDFTLTVEGEDAAVAREDLPTFYANSREQATLGKPPKEIGKFRKISQIRGGRDS